MKHIVLIILTAALLKGADDTAPAPLAPAFTAVVAKGGGLWPQIQVARDGSLFAFASGRAAAVARSAHVFPPSALAHASTSPGSVVCAGAL